MIINHDSLVNDTKYTQYKIKTIGAIAYEALAKRQEGLIIGTTSRGFFVLMPTGRIVFVSYNGYRSPSTITFGQVPPDLRDIKPATSIWASRGKLFIPSINIVILASSDDIWTVPSAHSKAVSRSRRFDHLRILQRAISDMNPMSTYGALLPLLLDPPVVRHNQDENQVALLSKLLELKTKLKDNLLDLAPLLIGVLGSGRGLTPSGDDFIIGLLLSLNRWGKAFNHGPELHYLNRIIVRAANEKTTTISSNLIESAANGQSDERLVNAVDAVFSGNPAIFDCIYPLMDWGASSGMDALAGIAMAANFQ
jgi:hypothetical protein